MHICDLDKIDRAPVILTVPGGWAGSKVTVETMTDNIGTMEIMMNKTLFICKYWKGILVFKKNYFKEIKKLQKYYES